jgi:hypothetical protein
MKPIFIVLLVLAFAAGLLAGHTKVYYRIQSVNANMFDVACAEGRPITTMRLDDVMEVHCHTPTK